MPNNMEDVEVGEFSYMLVAGKFCTTADEFAAAQAKNKNNKMEWAN
jgi:hypothetical protein